MSASSRATVKGEMCECYLVLWSLVSCFKFLCCFNLFLYHRDELMKKSNGTYFPEEV